MKKMMLMLMMMIMMRPCFAGQVRVEYVVQGEGEIREPEEGVVEEEDLGGVVERALTSLAEEGYPLAEVDSVTVEADGKVRLARLYLNTGPVLVETSTEEGRRTKEVTRVSIEQESLQTLDSLTENGFLFAKVSYRVVGTASWRAGIPDRPDLEIPNREGRPGMSALQDAEPGSDGNSLQVRLIRKVEPGPFLRMSEARFPGGEWISRRYLQLETRLERGSALKGSEITRARARLEKLPVVKQVGEAEIVPASPGYADIRFPLETRSGLKASGIVAIAPNSKEPRGELEIEIAELFGGGRSLSLGWQGLDPVRSEIEAGYRENWIGGLPLSARLELTGRSGKGIYQSSSYRIGVEWEPWEGIAGLAGWSYQRYSNLQDTTVGQDSQTDWLESSLTIDRMDREWNPAQGYRLTATQREGKRRFETVQSVRLSFTRSAIQGVTPVAGMWYLFGRGEVTSISGKMLTPEDLLRFEGDNRVRGFEEGLDAGKGRVIVSGELRWRPNPYQGYLGVGIDAGRVIEIAANQARIKRNLISVGLTSSLETEAGRLGVDLFWPMGERFEATRLHFRITGWM
jgi:outer membrane protein assembly factor BamA